MEIHNSNLNSDSNSNFSIKNTKNSAEMSPLNYFLIGKFVENNTSKRQHLFFLKL